ncbi:hypothetical protein DFH08DRAFT_153812 [Mycena albidolilacea]|uniref:Zinc-finger domain-containing protein n=1 Tax=Mycena albidolilacea TaxID=1033008 RepID=A0AAD7A1W0_9AGAR|nr:hypothetical protein DFH08DRAFT_153812 [Mycena albidolilacea]
MTVPRRPHPNRRPHLHPSQRAGSPRAFRCRRKTKRLSMKFDGCIHCYCVACIMMKYGGITIPFEAISSSENCPRCNDICSCDNCTSRRGEEYQFGRYHRPKDTPESELVLRGPRTSGAVRVQNNPYRMLDQMVIEPITHYATLYNLSGAPIGQTFLGADGNSEYVVAKPTQPRRVFVGAVPDSWLLGPDPVVYQMPLKVKKQEKKQKPNRRLYVGDPSVLALRVRPRALPVPPSTSPIQAPLPIAAPAAPSAPAPVQAEMDVDLPDPLSVEAVPAAPTTPPRVPSPDMDPVVAIATPAAPLTLPANVQAEMDVDLPDPVSVETGPAAPTTPPHVPSPDMDVDLPDPFGSPLTSVADSETAGEEDAQGASEKVGNEGAFTMPGDDDAEQFILDAHGEPEAADLDTHATSEIACVQDVGHNPAQAQSGRGLPFNPADGSAGRKFSQTDGDDRCDTRLAGASPLTHPPITVTEIDTVDIISYIPTAELPPPL